jgi:hypothetical protein
MNRKFNLLCASLLLVLAVPATALAVCDPQPKGCNTTDNMDVPTISCLTASQTSITLRVCAGASGASGGITIQWALNDPSLDPCHQNYSANTICELSLSGKCSVGTWALAPNECKDITINASTVTDQNAAGCGASWSGTGCGDLKCDTDYIFFVFAHQEVGGRTARDRSCFSEGVVCSTKPCDNNATCPKTWGYWKTHGPAGCDPSGQQGDVWAAGNQTVGGLSLNHDQLCAIFQNNPSACGKGGGSNSGSNAVLILEHQLIAAELNLAAGALNCDWVVAAIANANALLSSHENDCVGTSTALGQDLLAVKDILASYNEDEVNCSCGTKPLAAPGSAGKATKTTQKSWGSVKVIYR